MLSRIFSTRLLPRLFTGAAAPSRNVVMSLAAHRVVGASAPSSLASFSTSRLVLQAKAATATATEPATPSKTKATSKTSRAKSATKTGTKTKAAVKKTGKKTSIRKPAAKKKAAVKKVKAAAPKKKKAAKKVPYKVTREDKPPSLPQSGYNIFTSRFVKAAYANSTGKGAGYVQVLVKSSANAWNALSEHEKQAFRDEASILQEEYHKKRQTYNETVSRVALRELNKQRKLKGKTRILVRSKNPRPAPIFMHYMKEKLAEMRAEGRHLSVTAAAKEVGSHWKQLTMEEKKPYYDLYRQALDEWKLKQQQQQ